MWINFTIFMLPCISEMNVILAGHLQGQGEGEHELRNFPKSRPYVFLLRRHTSFIYSFKSTLYHSAPPTYTPILLGSQSFKT